MQIHHLQGYIEDIYLIEYPDKLLLLDAGCRCDSQVIIDFIVKTLHRKPSDLKILMVTHVHPDHAGGVSRLRRATGCKVVTGLNDRHWYAGISGMTNYTIDLLLAHYIGYKQRKPFKFLSYNPYLKADYYLSDKDTIPEFSDWQVFLTKGHTDRDLTLYHKKSRTAYVADLVVKIKRGYVAPYPIYLPEAYRNSLDLLEKLNLKTLLLAHGGQQEYQDIDILAIKNKAPKNTLNNNILIRKKLRDIFIK